MFSIIDKTIYYDGRELAVITAPLSGWRMDAVDALNLVEHLSAATVADIIREIHSDVNQVVTDTLTAADDAVWVNEAQREWIKTTIDNGLTEKLSATWNSWRAI